MPKPISFSKPKSFKASMKKLIGFCKSHLWLIIISMLLAAAGSVFQLIGPNKIQDLTSVIQAGLINGIDMGQVSNICSLLLSLYLAGLVCNYVQGFIMTTVTQKTTSRLRRSISKKINVLPLKYFDGTQTGDVLSRVTNDVDTIGQTLQSSITSFVHAAALFVGAIIMMFVTNWILALAAIGSTVFSFFIMALIMSKSQKHFIRQQVALGALNGHIEEVYGSHTVVKVYNAQKQTKKKFDNINADLRSSGLKSHFLSGLMMPIMGFVGNFGYVVVCVVGSVLAISGTIGFGVIVAFMIYIRQFTQPLSQFAQAASSFQSTAAASERVFQFLDEKPMESESDKQNILVPSEVKGDVTFSNVKFGYDEKIIINNFSANIKAGQKVAIVGPTGAGKTTLVNLLMRFYEINEGKIEIDGVDISQTTRQNIHDVFGMVLQDSWLFEGSILENVLYNNKTATQDDVVAACKACGLHHFIKTLPQGYNTIINENITISAGQKQLLTIARAMVQNAPMLILDEATSSVDTRTEILIQNAMDKLTQNRTSFVIAHRLSTIKNADLILVLSNGDIIEQGNHQQLLENKGFYYNLYNSQFDEENAQ